MAMLASVSGVVGNPGQPNYGAGCAFQDALARFRFTQKKKTASIDLSVIQTTGVVAKSKALQRHLDIAENHLG